MNKSELTNEEYAFINKMSFVNEEERLAFIKFHKKNKKDFNDVFNSESFIKAIESSLTKESENIINSEKIYMQEEIERYENTNCNNKLPNRADEKYTRIEGYEDYEFTHCIAYEMAIRNENVKKLTSALEKLNSLSFDIFSNFSSELNSENKIINLKKLINKIMSLSKTLNANNPHEASLETHNKFSTDLDNNRKQIIKEKFIQIIDENEKDYLISIMKNYENPNIKPLLLKYKENDLEKLFNKANLQDKFILIDLLKTSIQDKLAFEYFVVDEKKSIIPKDIENFIDKDTNYEPTPEINYHFNAVFTKPNYKENCIHEIGYKAFQGAYEKDNSFTINKVIPNFQKPLRMFNTIDISINPSLPLNDILAFVKKIKEDYDKNNSFKSFFELTEEDLNLQNDKTTLDKKISFTKEKWADMFYIYDYFQFYFSEDNKINKGKTENEKLNKENDFTTVAKEISLQLSFYHILKHKKLLDFSVLADIDDYKSAYNKYEMNLFYEIKEKIKENKKYEKYIKSKNGEKEETINFYMTADHIKIDYYPKMEKLIKGVEPEYLKLVAGKNHALNSIITKKNNVSHNL